MIEHLAQLLCCFFNLGSIFFSNTVSATWESGSLLEDDRAD
jgi:hypothetical protein